MHTVWKGTISFGLVNIPVKLHSATEDRDIKLRQLHKKCNNPIKYKKTCSHCNEEVKQEDIIMAYEYAPDKFIALDKDDLDKIKNEQEEKAVDIINFVKLEEIDPIYFDKSYYLSPGDGGSKAYALLRRSLSDSGKIGLAKIMIRSKEKLAVIRPYNNTLIMESIHYPDEVRSIGAVPNVPESVELSKKELDTATLLIDQLTEAFEPEKYTDDYRTALMELIQEKMAKEEGIEKKNQPDNVVDLMKALEESIKKTKPKKTTSPRKTPERKKA
ncbi:non-homologous end joining protein Ku [Alkaliphilus peptidifermentans]|uniref:Non-homologous end joining protein Ku n=1 Tax=Alkaliphilus peptidifermentans DSM 18978 TaxID=1120976 RepID=A0A1G5LB49_9FIRM|nr:Ku protein [Alkaliphilus peptidifermentans]SCZ10147.1 DNA end-binding protein Ku [Alkaliphilus peptidifermentans DSM 18978]